MSSPHDGDPHERYLRPRDGGTRATEPAGAGRRRSGPQLQLPARQARRQRAMLLATSLMSVFVLLASGGAWAFSGYALKKVGRVDVFKGLDNRPGGGAKGAMNILLVGADNRSTLSPEMRRKLNVGYAPGKRSDTMILAHISADRDKVTMVSLPRDSYVTIPAHENPQGERVPAQQNKLNASYSIGGAPLALATVERATGVRIDHYIEVNFLGFIKIVNALGGVNICLPKDIHDEKSGLDLPAGKHHVNGITALSYVRARHGFGNGSDLGRIERQQKFLASMMNRALSTGVLLDPKQFSKVLNAGLAAVQVDAELTKSDMRTLATSMRSLSPKHVTFLTVPLASKAHTVPGVGSTVLWDEQQAGRLFRRIKYDKPISGPANKSEPNGGQGSGGSSAGKGQGKNKGKNKGNGDDKRGSKQPTVTIPPQRIEVDVRNATNVAGLGSRARQELLKAGFLVPGAARNAQQSTGGQTVIEYGVNRAESARTVHAAIPGSTMRKNPALGDGLRVLLGTSYDGTRQVTVKQGAPGQQGQQGQQGSQGQQGQQQRIKADTAAEIPCT